MFEVGCAGIVVADTFCGPLECARAVGCYDGIFTEAEAFVGENQIDVEHQTI
jgi:hypothetical protein